MTVPPARRTAPERYKWIALSNTTIGQRLEPAGPDVVRGAAGGRVAQFTGTDPAE